MSVKTKAQLKTDVDNKIFENSTQSISATNDNGIRKDLIDSSINRIDDAALLGLREFSATVSYDYQQGVLYLGGLYQCSNVAGHTGAWNPADFTLIGGQSSQEGISGAGANQATATQLTTQMSSVDTVAAGTGVKTDAATTNQTRTIINNGANDLLVYPKVGEQFYGFAVNAPITLTPGGILKIFSFANTIWKQI